MKRKYIYMALLGVFILMQFFRIDKTNPMLEEKNDFMTLENPSTEIESRIINSCYDCHSDQSKYPWHTNVAPLSWWIKGHITSARDHLNFSIWGSYSESKQKHKLDECIDMVEKKWMPMFAYTWMHSEAKMSEEEREELIAYFESLK